MDKVAKHYKIVRDIRSQLHCRDVVSVDGLSYSGHYYKGTITVSKALTGYDLVDTLFHEDRHYQQVCGPKKYGDYIRSEEDLKGYWNQYVERDARRYAYVQTHKYIKYLFPGWRGKLIAYAYKRLYHPWFGIHGLPYKE